MEHKEPDGIEPDDLPTVHVLRLFRVIRLLAVDIFPVLFGCFQLSVQFLHALQRPVVAELPIEKQFLAEQKFLRRGQQRVNQPLRVVSILITNKSLIYHDKTRVHACMYLCVRV